jgi:general secretion pathway protein E
LTAAPSAEFLSVIPHDFARRNLLLSAGAECESDTVTERLLVADSTRPAAIYNVSVALDRPVATTFAPAEDIAAAVDAAYSRAKRPEGSTTNTSEVPVVEVEGSADVESDLARAVEQAEQDLLNTSGKAPAVRLVDLILFEALQRRASDVHVQPLRDRTLVRYRLDGALHTARELPASVASSVVSRVKVMARLDVAERRAPQDGRASVTVGGTGRAAASRRIDLRVSTLPSTYGERLVLRLLDPARSPHLSSFTALGMPPPVERAYLSQASRSHGIVLSTGPTGSGKTTTLYATLNWISSTNAGALTAARGSQTHCELNMMTIEDPVEYDLSASGLAVSQTQVDPKKGVTFAAGLRHILRQDPDVIMVGEIRDAETARIAVQASLTGHLVLSTLHTNDAASAIARLIDLSVEPFLVASSLSAVLAQRLVRTLHGACAGLGCDECLSTGFKGRLGVFELLVVDDAIRALTSDRASADRIKAAAVARGMTPLRDAGAALVRAGVTTAAEVARVINPHESELEADAAAEEAAP